MRQLTIVVLILLRLTSFGQDKNSDDSTTCIFPIEPMPSYPGGHSEMINFIKKNLKYPMASRTVLGKVYVEVVVNVNGSLSDFKIVKGLGDSFDNSALQTVKKMPNWTPAKRGEKSIRTKIVIPITFD